MSFSSFKSFGNQVAIPKLLKNIIMVNEFLKNESFESPVINEVKYYNDMTTLEKEQFKWVGGGNSAAGGRGPAISYGGKGFTFPNYINGQQALAIQSTSFIEQTIYLNVGTYLFSTYFYSRGGQYNPIHVSINGDIITTIDQVVNIWTLFTHTFNILVAGDKTLRLEGTIEADVATGIDLVALSRKPFPYIPIPNDKMVSNTTTQKGAEGYKASVSFSEPAEGQSYYPFNGDKDTYWHSQISYSSNGDYIGSSNIGFFTTLVSSKQGESQSISGEWMQIKIPSAIVLKSFAIQNRQNIGFSNRYPKLFTLVGSNGLTDSNSEYIWEEITTITLSGNPNNLNLNTYSTVSNTISYSYYRLILQKTFGGNAVHFTQFNLYRYEEGRINTDFQNFLANNPPYAYFRATDYIENTREIPAKIGNFTATTTGETLTVGPGAGYGADASIPFLIGTTNSMINFNVYVPTNFTVCSITRYTNSTDQNKRKIILGYESGDFFLHGHWNSSRGVAYYGKWISPQPIQNADFNAGTGSLTDWLVMCGKNNSQPTKNVLADNIEVGNVSGGTGGQKNLSINKINERSDFAFNQLLLWDKVLTDDEMQAVSEYLMQYLVDGLD
jgi:hypothetical protein